MVLRPLPGGNGSLPRDVNERGEVVGFCQCAVHAARPCLWRQGRPRDLGTLDERGTGTALAVNDKGEVVGDNQTFISGGLTRAFLWRRGVLTDLGGVGDRSATGINNHSQVIGVHYTSNGQRGLPVAAGHSDRPGNPRRQRGGASRHQRTRADRGGRVPRRTAYSTRSSGSVAG